MAGIIKAGTTAPTHSASEPAPFQFIDVQEHAKAQLAAAKSQSAALLASAQREAETIKRNAEQLGQQAALAKAEEVKRREVASQINTLMPALQQLVDALDEAHRTWQHHWERNLIHLACRIAEKVIRRELSQAPSITLDLLRESLELASGHNHLRIDLHPDDLATLGEQAERMAATWNRSATVVFTADPEIPRGSCRTQTEAGTIDQRFDRQLQRIEQELNS